MPSRTAPTIAALAVALGLGGCALLATDTEPPPEEAVEDPVLGDTPSSMTEAEVDLPPCMNDAQCDDDSFCEDGRCVPLPSCQTYVDCPGDYICSDGQCAPDAVEAEPLHEEDDGVS